MNKKIYRWIIAVGAISALAAVLPIMAASSDKNSSNEQEIALQDCPKAVQKAINDNAQGGEVIEVEKETSKDGKVVYEAEIKKADGKKFDVKIAEDGTLIGTDEDADDDDDQEQDDD